MPRGLVEIVEFTGIVPESKRGGEVSAYILAIDGVYAQKYGRPDFSSLPRSWVNKFRIATFDVGYGRSWKDFFDQCIEILEREKPFGKPEIEEERASIIATLNPFRSDDELTHEDKRQLVRERMEKLLDAVPERKGSAELDEITEIEEMIEEFSEVSVVESEETQTDNSASSQNMAESIALLFTELLSEPLERPLSLKFEINGYMSLLRDDVMRFPTIELSVAAAIANGAFTLLETFEAGGYADNDNYRFLQAAIRYFTVSEDANNDYDPGGFDDDAAVFNHVARLMKREELVVDPAKLRQQNQ